MNQDEIQTLSLFCNICDTLAATSFGQHFSVTPCKSYRVQPNTLYSTRVPWARLDLSRPLLDSDLLRSFLLSFRKLISEKEPANIYKVMVILGRYGNQADRERLRRIRRELRNVGYSIAGVSIGMGNPPRYLRPKEVVETLFNGVFFHNDPSRTADLAFFLRWEAATLLAMLHYMIYIYKQALRLVGAIKLRNLISVNDQFANVS